MKTNDRPLTDLMKAVDSGTAQLPDFQRDWVWGDERIKASILSVIRNFSIVARERDKVQEAHPCKGISKCSKKCLAG